MIPDIFEIIPASKSSFEIIPASESSFKILDSPSNQNVMPSKEISRDKPDSFDVVVDHQFKLPFSEKIIVDSLRWVASFHSARRPLSIPLRLPPGVKSTTGAMAFFWEDLDCCEIILYYVLNMIMTV